MVKAFNLQTFFALNTHLTMYTLYNKKALLTRGLERFLIYSLKVSLNFWKIKDIPNKMPAMAKSPIILYKIPSDHKSKINSFTIESIITTVPIFKSILCFL